jgi:hypothetical protein
MSTLVPENWPDSLDAAVTVVFLAVVVLVPVAGYVFMALDFRAYLRSLRRGLIVVGRYFTIPHIPDWARQHTPRAVAALGLRMPCTEEDLLRAYRTRVMHLHPDHGGDQRRFLLLQANFEEALALVRAASQAEGPQWSARHAAM